MRVSLQVAILKVLVSYPSGHATLAEMKADLAILAGAGPEWNARLKRLSARLPDLDIFSQGLVLRDAAGWTLSSAGRHALLSMEQPAVEDPDRARPSSDRERGPRKLELVPSAPARQPQALAISNVIELGGRRRRRLRINGAVRPAS
jgi:hypothetical protein